VIVNALDVKQITTDNLPLFQAMMEGYGEALAKARLVNLTGEVAVMKHSITAFCDQGSNQQLILTWGATCTGLAHRDRLINPANITPNMVIVGFWEPGYRCNGGTFFTNLLLQRYGNDISQIQTNPEAMDFVRQLTIPSLSYARTVARLVGWNPDGSLAEPLATIAGIAHITGGGVWGKFGEILPDGVGAVLNTMPKPAKVLRTAQEFSWDIPGLRLTDAQAYGTLHGGCGMLFVCHDRDSAEAVIEEADKDGIRAQIVGHTTASPERELVIDSRFKQGRILSSLAREESS
jgi:phosphoribosylaminoimidazole (AIR) synthetase